MSSVVETKRNNWPDDRIDLGLQQITNCTQVKISMKTEINLYLDSLASASRKQSSQTKFLNLKNVLRKCIVFFSPLNVSS